MARTVRLWGAYSHPIEAWLAAAVLSGNADLMTNLECSGNWETRLQGLPKNQRIRKTKRDYAAKSHSLTPQWPQVCGRCTQAKVFHDEGAGMATNQGW
ncbi:MAG: hypothetical protein AB1758_02645 [Candidatus Eremiobacterota bacterium]